MPFNPENMEITETFSRIDLGNEIKNFKFPETPLMLLELDNVTPLPGYPVTIKITDSDFFKAIENVSESGECVFAAFKIPGKAGGHLRDYYPIGVVARPLKTIVLPDDTSIVFLHPMARASLKKLHKGKELYVDVVQYPEMATVEKDMEYDMLISDIVKYLQELCNFISEDNRSHFESVVSDFEKDPAANIHFISNNFPFTVPERARLISANDNKELLTEFLRDVYALRQKFEVQERIAARTHFKLSEHQKRMFLTEQMNSIKTELGENFDEDSDENELLGKSEEKNWDSPVQEYFEKELRKLMRYNPQSPEYALQYSYLDTFLSLPWNDCSPSEFSLSNVEKVLDRDHYGLEKVKERILEQMAVIKQRNDMKAPIICLYGAPGVGKTSLGKSIADAMGREYVRVSLGGIHDEAEIRGHRRTYLGSMPGRIISSLAKCGKSNPVFVLDEIDKMGKGIKGDPAQALLEVLDPEQNNRFHDNYIDFDYDLSQVFFLATANDLSEISRPLLDRMEIIEIDGYITAEKVEIARRHLVPKTLESFGFKKNEFKFTDDAIRLIIESYTRESGVRQLEKKIGKVLRKIARKKMSGEKVKKTITAEMVKALLGLEEVRKEIYENNDFPGVVTGLAWTRVGGEILFIESSLSSGNGEKLTLTGQLGDVMKESAVIALQYLKAHSESLGIDPSMFTKNNVHVHVPEGAVPKDGPSAGITIATSLASSFTGRKVRPRLAMTGEITLRGKVLPVGGIKEKVLAARRAGITDIILSRENQRDIKEINEIYLEGVSFHYVDTVSEVWQMALL